MFFAVATTAAFSTLRAEQDVAPVDSLRPQELEMVEVKAAMTMRSTLPVTYQGVTHTWVTPKMMQRYDINDLPNLSSRVPSLYIPDYGSKRSAAIYLRGVGARSSGQTIGFYVDGVPYLSKSAFNFDMVGIQGVEVLRGPQGTLYGRNAMAGIINLYTGSALSGNHLSVKARYGSYGQISGRAVVRRKLGDKFGVSVGGAYNRHGGYFYNETTKAMQDSLSSINAFAKLEWRPSDRFDATLSGHFDQVRQGGFPYQRLDAKTGVIQPLDFGDPGMYERRSWSGSLRLRYVGYDWQLVSATGFQDLEDKTQMDMDGSPAPMFHVVQGLKQRAYTQEFVFKNRDERDRYQWNFGVFGFYDDAKLMAPVKFRPVGIHTMIQSQLDKQRQANPRMPHLMIDARSDVLNNNLFAKPEWGVALYHESTVRDLLFEGLSATAGLRLDYSHQQMDYDSSLGFRIGVVPAGAQEPKQWLEAPSHLVGVAKSSGVQLLPKFSLQYERANWLAYATVSKGFKAGGFNEQTLSDVIRIAQMQDLQNIFSKRGGFDPAGLNDKLGYQSETAWNYELGFRLSDWGIIQHFDLSAYYLDVRNLQLTRFVASGAGREISNAGRSYTLGAEATAKVKVVGPLSAMLSYGYTRALFRAPSAADIASGVPNYEGKYVPFIPEHTYSVSLNAEQALRSKWFTHYFASVEYAGLGRIYWNESNTTSDAGYATLGARLGFGVKQFTLTLWGKNLFGQEYTAFRFKSFSDMVQRGAPRSLGVDLGFRL